MIDFLTKKISLLIVLALMVAYSAYFSALSIQRHNTFRTSASDMGQMDQALWNTLHGHLLEDTRQDPDRNTAHQAPRLTDHVEPIFIPVSLVYLLYDGIESILILQSIAVALGALPIFWIARRRLRNDREASRKDWAAIVFAAMYLLFPALEAANLAEFHAVTLAPAPLLFAYNYAQERDWKRFAFFALIALAVKEDMALLVFMLALWAAVQSTVNSSSKMAPQQPTIQRFTFHVSRFTFELSILPLAIAALSIVWFLIALYVIVPHFSPRNESVYIGRYPQSPLALLTGLFEPDKLRYVIGLLASGGLIAILDPVSLLLGAPSLVLNLLSSYPAQYSGTYHYSAPVAPYFILAAIGGAAWLRDRLAQRVMSRLALVLPVAIALVVSLGYHAIAGYTPLGGEFFWPESTPHQQILAHFLDQIPPDVPVSTTKTLFPHLSHRRFLYRFPTIQDAEYILLDVSQSTTRMPVDFRKDYIDALQQGYGVRDALDGYILLQRGLATTELPDGFYTFAQACSCKPIQYPVIVDFDNKIRFLGYDVKQDDWGRVYLRTYWTRLDGFDGLNYALHPFYAAEDGRVREDAPIPDMLIHFWYPSSHWQPGEIVVAETTPVDLGPRARLGLGVFFGATWDEPDYRLAPQTDLALSTDGAVWLGDLVREGKGYRVSPPARILP